MWACRNYTTMSVSAGCAMAVNTQNVHCRQCLGESVYLRQRFPAVEQGTTRYGAGRMETP